MLFVESLLRMGGITVGFGYPSGHEPVAISEIRSIAYAANVELDCNLANDFAISALTGDLAITWANAQIGNTGTLIVRQDGVGGRLVTLTPPAGFTLLRDSTVADLAAAPGAADFTRYWWAFSGVFPTAILIVGKVLPVP